MSTENSKTESKQLEYETENSETESDQDEELDPEDNEDIRNISIKPIDKAGYFGMGNYGEFKVYLMLKTDKDRGYKAGYINATKLCQNAGKQLGHWVRNDDSKKMIETFFSAFQIRKAELIIKINTGSKHLTQLRGTYVHPDLIPHIASWASPEFAIKVSKIVNKYIIDQAIEDKNRLLKKKQDKIDRMSAKIDKLLDNNKELLTNNKELLLKNDEQSLKLKKMNTRMKRLLKKNDQIHEEVQDINGKLTTAVHARVVSTGKLKDNNMLIIIKNNDDPEEYDEDEKIYEYYCMRILKSTYCTQIAQHKKRHPDMKILLEINYSPNSINLFKRIKDKLKGKIEFDKCSFNLCGRYTEKRLIDDIKEIHNERLDTEDL